MFLFVGAWTNGWANNPATGNLRRHRAHYDATEMIFELVKAIQTVLETRINNDIHLPHLSHDSFVKSIT